MNSPSVIGNLKTANQGVFFLLLLALPFDNALFHFASFLLLITFFLSLYEIGKSTLMSSLNRIRAVHMAFLGILVVMGLSNLLNGQGIEAWSSMLKFAARYWFLLIMLQYLMDEQILSLRFMFITAIIAIAVQILPFVPLVADGSIFSNRFYGFTHGPNVVGFYLAIGLLLSIEMAFGRQSGPFLSLSTALVLSILFLLSLIATGSRGSWVAFLGAACCLAQTYIMRRPFLVISFGLFLGTAAGWVSSSHSLVDQRLELLLRGHPALRDEVWSNAVSRFAERPLLGYGLDTRAVLLESHYIYTEHNIFLSIAMALGTVGIFAYGTMIYFVITPAIRARKIFPLALMLLLFLAGMFSFDFYRNQAFMVSFVLVACACLQSVKVESRETAPKNHLV